MPFFSVITINLNNRQGLKNTIASVASQTFRDFEYLVIDGGSKDGSVDVILECAKDIKSWISDRDSGVYNAMNKGLKMAQGKYVVFLNSGDEFKLSDTLKHIAEQGDDRDFVYCDVELFGGQSPRVKVHPDQLSERYLLVDMICHQSVFAKRSLFDKTGTFNEAYKVYGDYDWMLNAIRSEHATYKHIPEVLVRYDEIGISNTTDRSLQRKEKDQIQNFYFNGLILWVYRIYRRLNDRVDGKNSIRKWI
jgi:glycosyltransferase involved in cell wall biosynthesis